MLGLSLGEWLRNFCALHDRARQTPLVGAELDEYRKAREELANVLVLAQRLSLQPGENPRKAVRVAQALQVEFEMPTGKVSALTLDLSVGGLSSLVSDAPPVGSRLSFKLKLGRNQEPVLGAGKVVNVAQHKGSVRLALMFEEMSPADRERTEAVIFDAIVKQFIFSLGISTRAQAAAV